MEGNISQVGNHDNHRMATRYGPPLVDGINMIVLLLPGVGVTYMVRFILDINLLYISIVFIIC